MEIVRLLMHHSALAFTLNGSRLWLVEAGQEIQQRCFAAPGWTDNRYEFAMLHLERDVFKHTEATVGM